MTDENDDSAPAPPAAKRKRAPRGRKAVIGKLWKAAQTQLEAHEAHLAELPAGTAASEADAKTLATLARTVRELVALDSAAAGEGGKSEDVRHGEAAGLKQLEGKALSAGSGPDGGYLAPSTVESEILRRLSAVSPIRALATVRTISSGTYKKAFSTSGPASGWVAESVARPQTGTPALAELSFPAMELYAMPAATQTLLDDAIVDIDQWIAEEVESAFAEQEGAAFVNGDGVDKPRGFLAYPAVADASWSWGNIGTLKTGVAGAFAAANPADILVDLVYALKAGYRQNASFVMNRKTQAAVRKFKDSTGK
ncbi:MAG: phage major capsid protein [Bosea sp.]|nr:phage major capsid protein [Bosea sp. (in: a-proteobacteria)]